jgi:hypothetical protein
MSQMEYSDRQDSERDVTMVNKLKLSQNHKNVMTHIVVQRLT